MSELAEEKKKQQSRVRIQFLAAMATIISVLRIPQLLHNVSIEYILSPTGRVYIVRAALSHGSCLLLGYDYLISAAVIPCRTFRKSCISFPPEAQRIVHLLPAEDEDSVNYDI